MPDMDLNLWRNMTQPCMAMNYTRLSIYSSELTAYECDRFEYEGEHNIISEWDLVCDRFHLISVVEMCFLAGAAIGSICSGWVSDRYGRRHTLLILATTQTIFGTLLAFSSSLTMFMILRFIIGFASMGVTMVSFVLVVEMVSGKWRTIIGILDILPVALSYIIIAGIAYMTPNWRSTQLVISVPWFALLFIWFRLPESPRWLLVNGRIEELVKVIEIAAKFNKIKLPDNYEKTLEKPDEPVSVSFAQLFTAEYVRTTFLMIIVWYTLILLYFGITLHLNNLGGDIYLNTVIAGVLEAASVGLCILVVLKLGLKKNLVIYMLVAGLGCLMVNLVPDSMNAGVITLAMIVKCATGATNALIPTFTALQYPTTMRTLSVGVGNCAAGFALVTVPYLWHLEHVQQNLPMTVMGIFGIIGAIGLLLMKNKQLNIAHSKNKLNSEKVAAGGPSGISNIAYQ